MAEVQVVKCPNCGMENEYGQPKCFKCGADLPVPAKPPPPRKRVSTAVKVVVGIAVFFVGACVSAFVAVLVSGFFYGPTVRQEYMNSFFLLIWLAFWIGYFIWVSKV